MSHVEQMPHIGHLQSTDLLTPYPKSLSLSNGGLHDRAKGCICGDSNPRRSQTPYRFHEEVTRRFAKVSGFSEGAA